MTSIICLLELDHLNGFLFDEWVNHVIKELNVEEALNSSILVVQKAATPKSGVEFCQCSNGTIRSSLATLYDIWWRRRFFFDVTNKQNETDKATYWCCVAAQKLEEAWAEL